MKTGSDCSFGRALCEKCKGLLDYQVRSKYDVSFWIYPNDRTDDTECAQRWTGDSRQHIWKIAAIIGGIAVFCASVQGLCRLARRI